MLSIADILEAEDVARVRQGLGGIAFRDGRETAEGAARKVKANRQSSGEDDRTRALAAFVRQALERNPTFMAYVRPARWSKPMFNAYGVGETYGDHVDKAMMGTVDERLLRTDLSYTVFLSDPDTYDGGELIMDGVDGQRAVKLPAGAVVVYPTTDIHRVDPVTRGERLACVGWVQSLIRRADERAILFDLSRVRSVLPDGEARLTMDKAMANLTRLWGEP